MNTASPTQLGPLEKELLEIVWQHHPVSVHEVLNDYCQNCDKNLAYTTVMTILSRLVKKGVLTRAKNGRTYEYSPAESKPEFVKSLVKSTLASFASKYGQEAIAAFAEEAASLSASDKSQLSSRLKHSKRSWSKNTCLARSFYLALA